MVVSLHTRLLFRSLEASGRGSTILLEQSLSADRLERKREQEGMITYEEYVEHNVEDDEENRDQFSASNHRVKQPQPWMMNEKRSIRR